MKAQELRRLLLYGEKTEENYRRLPDEAGGLWFSRPSRNALASGRNWLYGRLSLYVGCLVYSSLFNKHIDISGWWIIIACYEFAYYNTWKEKTKLESIIAEERYASSVDDLLLKLYPNYQPESDA